MRIVRPSTLGFHGLIAAILGGAVAVVGAHAGDGGAWWGLVAAGIVAAFGLRRPLRRWWAVRRPFPEAWRAWLHAHVPFYSHLDPDARRRFEQDVQIFLAEHTFEAVDGAPITDELRLGVAAGAALLLHGRPDWELPAGRTILIYPDRFDDDYYLTDDAGFDGMVHEQGPIILSAQAVAESWAHPGDGNNVVLHELAHLFDYENMSADGVPSLLDPASEASWRRLVRREMQHARLGKSLLRRYAATNPAEFFAVAVENFFERPELLRRRHAELFDVLVALFNLDPRLPEAPDAAPAPRQVPDA